MIAQASIPTKNQRLVVGALLWVVLLGGLLFGLFDVPGWLPVLVAAGCAAIGFLIAQAVHRGPFGVDATAAFFYLPIGITLCQYDSSVLGWIVIGLFGGLFGTVLHAARERA